MCEKYFSSSILLFTYSEDSFALSFELRMPVCLSPTIIDPNKTMSLVTQMIAMLRKVWKKCCFHFLRFITQKGHRYSELRRISFHIVDFCSVRYFFLFRIPIVFFSSYFKTKRKECKAMLSFISVVRVLFTCQNTQLLGIFARHVCYTCKHSKYFQRRNTKSNPCWYLSFEYLAWLLSISL